MFSLSKMGSTINLPILTPDLQAVYLIMLLGMAAWVSYLAHLTYGQTQTFSHRKIRFLTLAQGVFAGVRALEFIVSIASWPVLVAAHSLLDLTIVGLIIGELHYLCRRGYLPNRGYVGLTALALAGVFLGLVGGRDGYTLLMRNLFSEICQMMCYVWLGVLLLKSLVLRMDEDRQTRIERIAELTQGHQTLARESTDASRLHQEATDQLNQQIVRIENLHSRVGVLEQILEQSVSFNSTHTLQDLLNRIAAATGEIFEFGRVVLYLNSGSTEAFEARAFHGIPDHEKDNYSGVQISRETYAELTLPRFSYANCYLLGMPEDSIAGRTHDDSYRVKVSAWSEQSRLIVPLTVRSGETHGYLELNVPVDGLPPTLMVIQNLEFLASQSAAAIGSALVNESLAQNNRELAHASEKLTSLEEMKRNFVANVSHELRTPLTSISAYAELLQQDTTSMTDEVRSEFLKVINKESERLTGIIDDILELGSMEGKRTHQEPSRIDIADLTRKLTETWHGRALDHNIDLISQVGTDRVELDFDPILYQQLFGHLLSNAIKFTPSGGKVRVKLDECGTAVKLIVEDSGIGIPESEMEHIFDQFYQVDGSSTREHNGQGVGLAICHDVVSYHDGRIWVENVPTGGARFTVMLPRRPQVIQWVDTASQSREDDPHHFMERLLNWIGCSLGVQQVALLVPEPGKDTLKIRAAIGVPENLVQSLRIRKGIGTVGKVWSNGTPLQIIDPANKQQPDQQVDDLPINASTILCVPLIHETEFQGVLIVCDRIDRRELTEDDVTLLDALSPRVAMMLGKHQKFDLTLSRFAQLQESLRSTISLGHERQENLIAICHEIGLATAHRLELPVSEVEHLVFALQYYDVGLSRIPSQLIQKSGPLTAAEQTLFEQHVQASLDILAPLDPPSKVRQIILHHHEHFDGTGYPDGLKGEAIPLSARLLSLTDCFAAMLQKRSFRPARTYEEVILEIQQLAGVRLCPRLTPVFLAEAENRRADIESRQRNSKNTSELAQTSMLGMIRRRLF